MSDNDRYNGSTAADSERYNGWANRETWALNLWLSNDEGLYNLTREAVSASLASDEGPMFATSGESLERYRERRAGEAVKDLWDEIADADNPAQSREVRMMVREVGSAWRVDWDEIGAAWLADVTENPVSE